MGKCVERCFKKNSLKPNTASHNNASWYTDTDEFLELSPSGRSQYYKGSTLQKIILGFFWVPPYIKLLVLATQVTLGGNEGANRMRLLAKRE